MLRYTKNKNLEAAHERIDLKELVDEISKTYLIHFQSDVEIKTTVQNDVVFVSDKYRLMTVLQNLLSNAIHYRHPDREKVLITVDATYEEHQVRISVKDNGVGISEESQAKVFDMFYRDKTSTKGSGLGLYIVKKIVDRLGGRIELSSEVDVGTTFTIHIPNEAPKLGPYSANPLTTSELTHV